MTAIYLSLQKLPWAMGFKLSTPGLLFTYYCHLWGDSTQSLGVCVTSSFRSLELEHQSEKLIFWEPENTLPHELQKIVDTLELINANTTEKLPGVSHWRVIDNILPESYTIGEQRVCVQRGG